MVAAIRNPEALNARLEALFDRFVMRRPQIHHAVLVMKRGDGSFRWERAHGVMPPGARPMSADAPYFIASISKLYLATVVLLLVERGHLGLDDPIGAHLHSDVISGLHVWRGVDRTPEITVRHLLSHTSGLPDYIEGRPRVGPSFRDRLIAEGDADINPSQALRIVRDELTPHFAPQAFDAPRQKAFYADTNFLLLGLIVSAVTGQPLGRIYEELLFRPLDLRHTFLYGRTQPLAPQPELPAPIWFKDRPLCLERAMSGFIEDGLVSTANDTLRFLEALVHGRIFANPATLQTMQGRWNRIFHPFEYALGTMRFRLPRILTLWHLAPLVGHAGSPGSWLYHCAELDLLLAGTLDQEAAPSLPYRLLPRVLWAVQSATGAA